MNDTQDHSEAQRAEKPNYNGWSNYETWCVALWLSNDQGTDQYIRELVQAAEDTVQASKAVREYLEDLNPVADQASVFADLMNAALGEVDWVEVAEAFLEE